MIIYTGLCGRQRREILWEEGGTGGVKVDMLSLALFNEAARRTHTLEKSGEGEWRVGGGGANPIWNFFLQEH